MAAVRKQREKDAGAQFLSPSPLSVEWCCPQRVRSSFLSGVVGMRMVPMAHRFECLECMELFRKDGLVGGDKSLWSGL